MTSRAAAFAMSSILVAFLAVSTGCSAAAPLPPRAVELNRDGVAALASGDLETAEARFALALEYHPRFTEAWVNLGVLEMRRGLYDDAERDLRRARRLNEDLPAPHHALGVLAEKRGRLDDAEKHYRAALKVDPGFAPARENLARRLFARGDYEGAREQFLRLTEVRPDALDGWLGLVESLLRVGREDDADRTLAHARSVFGDRDPIVLLVARQMLRRGAFREAEAALAPLTASSSSAGAAWAWTAVARLGQGRRDGAIAAAREAQHVDGDDAVAAYVIAEARTP